MIEYYLSVIFVRYRTVEVMSVRTEDMKNLVRKR